jgi:hypothetical protein
MKTACCNAKIAAISLQVKKATLRAPPDGFAKSLPLKAPGAVA